MNPITGFLQGAFVYLRRGHRNGVTSAWAGLDNLEPRLLLAGDPAPDLVAFADALTDAGVEFFGAAWCPACTTQKQSFEDGAQFLPFIEVTNPDRSTNRIGIDENITAFPTWKFPNVQGEVIGVQTLEQLATLSGVDIPMSAEPFIAPIDNVSLFSGSPLHVAADGYDPNGDDLTYEIDVQTLSGDAVVSATLLEGNRSARIDVQWFGQVVAQLFEARVPEPTDHFIDLAQQNYFDDKLVYRTAPGLGVQTGSIEVQNNQLVFDPSPLPAYDDVNNDDLLHNRGGILSAQIGFDGTNNTEFLITDVPLPDRDGVNTVLGVLVEGETNRNALNDTAVAASPVFPDEDSFPIVPVSIEAVEIFEDHENAVFMLNLEDGTSGAARVTVTATDPDGNTFDEVFDVLVNAVTFSIGGEDQPSGISYYEQDGTKGTIAIKGAAADVTLHGMDIPDPELVEMKGKNYVLPDTVMVEAVESIHVAVDEDARLGSRKLTLKAKASDADGDDGLITVNAVETDGPMGNIDGKNAHFADGPIIVDGALQKFTADRLTNVQLLIQNVGDDAPMTKVKFDIAENFTIDAPDSPLDVKGDRFVNDDPNADGINSTYARNVKIKEQAAFALTLSGADAPRDTSLKSATFGELTGGTWQIEKHTGNVSAGSIANLIALITGDAKGFKSKDAIVDSIFEAETIATIAAKTDILRTGVTLNEEFDPNDPKAVANKTFKADRIEQVVYRSGNSVKTIQADRIIDSTFFVAVVSDDNTVLPDAADDFVAAAVDQADARAFIAAVKVKGDKDEPVWMNNVFFASPGFGKIGIGRAGPNAGVPYGFAAVTAKSFAYTAVDKDDSFKASKDDLNSPPGTVFEIDPTSDMIAKLV